MSVNTHTRLPKVRANTQINLVINNVNSLRSRYADETSTSASYSTFGPAIFVCITLWN